MSRTVPKPPDDPLRGLCDGFWQPSSATGPRRGLTFTEADPLDLATHPALAAATASPVAANVVAALEDRLAAFLGMPTSLVFPSGAEAIRHAFRALLREGDHVILDSAAPPAMFQAATLAGAQVHRSPAASVEGVQRRLDRLSHGRRRPIVAVPAVSAHASRIADLCELSALTRRHGALLVVDVSQDLGTMAPSGGGVAEIQACLPRIDVLLGDLSRSFATQAGFAAFRDPALHGTPHRDGRVALDPARAARILAALILVAGPECARRRRRLHGLSLRLRNHLMADGLRPMGQASPVISLPLPPATALPRTALLESAGPRVALLQAPTVPLHAPRWHVLLSAAHGAADIDDLAELIRDVSRAFDRAPARTRVPA